MKRTASELEYLMKTRLALIVLAVAFVTTCALAGPSSVRITRAHRSVKGAHYKLKASWPQISGLGDPSLQNRINTLLRASVPSEAPSPTDRAAMEPGQVFDEEVSYAVTLNAHHLLSVLYTGLGTMTLNGRLNAAHPTKLIRALTIDLDTGKVYRYADLFTSGADVLISKRIETALGTTIDEKRDFYLAGKKVVIIFPEAPFAVQGAEVPIPVADLARYANPAGPLARLLKP